MVMMIYTYMYKELTSRTGGRRGALRKEGDTPEMQLLSFTDQWEVEGRTCPPRSPFIFKDSGFGFGWVRASG